MPEKNKRRKGKNVISPQDTRIHSGSEPPFSTKDDTPGHTRSFRQVVQAANGADQAVEKIVHAKRAATKWRHYITIKRNTECQEDSKMGDGLGDIHEKFVTAGGNKKVQAAKNRALIQYFSKLGQFDCKEEADLDFVAGLIHQGADANCTDKYGQSIFHEVARVWSPDMGKFLLEHNADINAKDFLGRTPLHVAAAVDYADMCQFLIDNGAHKEARTAEAQTPVHFAARTDAVRSLAMLIKNNCQYKNVKDYRGRTPLYVAAELDRSETARFLIENKAPVGLTDSAGQPALTCMVEKMGPVAKLALDQLHHRDRANRQQQFYINHLEPQDHTTLDGYAKMPLQQAVKHRQFEILLHPTVSKLIHVKWVKYGRFGAFRALSLNVVFVGLWTTIALHSFWFEKCRYELYQDVWKIVIYVLAVGITIYQIADELKEFIVSQRDHNRWKEWRLMQVEKDLEYCHPKWPKESEFLKKEIQELDTKNKPTYLNDFWNIFDWICYILLVASTLSHLLDIFVTSPNLRGSLAINHNRIMSINIIMVWLRFMKYVRCFSLLGPFVVMLGEMFSDILRFLFLYIVFYIPFSIAFWMIFGGTHDTGALVSQYGGPNATSCIAANVAEEFLMHIPHTKGLESFDKTLLTMFRLTLVDEYDLDAMLATDSPMTYILLILWLFISAILCLNLLIALLSDTFQRVHDNAKANAVMQKALTILNFEESLRDKSLEEYRKYIRESCSPKIDEYDDDTGENADELQKVTIQTYEKLENLYDMFVAQYGPPSDEFQSLSEDEDFPELNTKGDDSAKSLPSITTDKLENEIDILRAEISAVEKKRREFERECLNELRNLRVMLGGQGHLVSRSPVTLPPLALDRDRQQSLHDTVPPGYPASLGERVTPRDDQGHDGQSLSQSHASVSHIQVSSAQRDPQVEIYTLPVDPSTGPSRHPDSEA